MPDKSFELIPQIFPPTEPVRPEDPRLRPYGARQTFARWRHEGRGPRYVKAGARVVYLGEDLNRWIAANFVTTSEK